MRKTKAEMDQSNKNQTITSYFVEYSTPNPPFRSNISTRQVLISVYTTTALLLLKSNRKKNLQADFQNS